LFNNVNGNCIYLLRVIASTLNRIAGLFFKRFFEENTQFKRTDSRKWTWHLAVSSTPL